MANVTVSPIDAGQVAVSIELENAEELPLAAQSLLVTLSNPDAPVAAATTALAAPPLTHIKNDGLTPDVVDHVMCSGFGWRQGPIALLRLPTSLLSK